MNKELLQKLFKKADEQGLVKRVTLPFSGLTRSNIAECFKTTSRETGKIATDCLMHLDSSFVFLKMSNNLCLQEDTAYESSAMEALGRKFFFSIDGCGIIGKYQMLTWGAALSEEMNLENIFTLITFDHDKQSTREEVTLYHNRVSPLYQPELLGMDSTEAVIEAEKELLREMNSQGVEVSLSLEDGW